MKKNNHNSLYISFLFTLLVLYFINSKFVISSILDYTNLFIKNIFPANFIFYILSSLLLDFNLPQKISSCFHVNGATFYVVILSMISGFPSGSKYIKDLYIKKLISIKTANYLLLFTHFPNPIFILGPVSNLFINKNYSIYILFSLIVSNFIIGLVFRPIKRERLFVKNTYSTNSFSISLTKAINSSIKILLLIYGVSVFFYLIASIICKYIRFNTYYFIIINGFFDMTKGIFLTSIIPNDFFKAMVVLLFVSFGGLSINMQVKSIISDTDINYFYFLIGRVLQFLISFVLFFICSRLV